MMQQIKNILIILKNNSGISLLFVLGIMLLFFAIGGSAIAAASANVGGYIRQMRSNQIRVLEYSIHRNIKFSLLDDPENPDLMSYQIVMALLEANDPEASDYNTDGLEEINLRVGNINFSTESINVHDTNSQVYIEDIILSFPLQNITITAEVPEIPAIMDGDTELSPKVDGIPRSASVNARMEVTVITGTQGRTITSLAIYEFTGGVLSEMSGAMQFTPEGYGKWSLISYDSIQ